MKKIQPTVSFTLPISCQICLGKVKEPVTCSNHHVYCNQCIELWLQNNNKCPTCRVEITPQSPIRPVLGGSLDSNSADSVDISTRRQLRKARYQLILKEYEEDLLDLDRRIKDLREENNLLKDRLKAASKNKPNPILSGGASGFCIRCSSVDDFDELLDSSRKLKETSKNYKKAKKELAEMKQLNGSLMKKNDDLQRENTKIREELVVRSPMKFGRLTVATLESRLEASQKEVALLEKALQQNDKHNEQLKLELASLKKKEGGVDEKDEKLKNPELNHQVQDENPVLFSLLQHQKQDPENKKVAADVATSINSADNRTSAFTCHTTAAAIQTQNSTALETPSSYNMSSQPSSESSTFFCESASAGSMFVKQASVQSLTNSQQSSLAEGSLFDSLSQQSPFDDQSQFSQQLSGSYDQSNSFGDCIMDPSPTTQLLHQNSRDLTPSSGLRNLHINSLETTTSDSSQLGGFSSQLSVGDIDPENSLGVEFTAVPTCESNAPSAPVNFTDYFNRDVVRVPTVSSSTQQATESPKTMSSSFSRKLDFEGASASPMSVNNLSAALQNTDSNDGVSSELSSYCTISRSLDFSQAPDCNSPTPPALINQQTSANGLKTTINAGGSRITMTKLSAEEKQAFKSRPCSAPSRTFLLSGTCFSSLRQIKNDTDQTQTTNAAATGRSRSNSFKPLTRTSTSPIRSSLSPCSSIEIMPSPSSTSHHRRQHSGPVELPNKRSPRTPSPYISVSPDDVIDGQWKYCLDPNMMKTNENSSNSSSTSGEKVKSRVNILKRNGSFTTSNSNNSPPPPHHQFSTPQSSKFSSALNNTMVTLSEGGGGRRKQRFNKNKRSSDITLQSRIKSPKTKK